VTRFDRYLVLSQADWSGIFSSKKVTGSAYVCIAIGFGLWFFNSAIRLSDFELSFRLVYSVVIFSILILMLIGIYKHNFYAIPVSIIGFNLSYALAIFHQSFVILDHINVVTVCYSILYFLINAIVFRLTITLVLNFFVFLSVAFCAIAPQILGSGSSQPLLFNAVILSGSALVLQHLVLTVRGMLIEQLGAVKLQVAAVEAEVEIENARREAREKTVRLSRISVVEALGASIAHEINQPIAAASTYCQAMRNWSAIECQDAPETLRALAGVESNVDRAARLVENIRLLTTNKDRHYAQVDIRELVRDQIDLMQAEFDRRGIRLEYEPEPAETAALVCASEVALATINLLRNAMEAFDDPIQGAVVRVVCRQPSSDWVEILVIDNGRGLSPEGIQMAFGAFQTTKDAGAGIGLSICQKVAEHHSGSISLSANPGGGLSATLRLAAKAPHG